MRKAYIVWNLTNYGDGYEFLGVYLTKAQAKKAYNAEMKERYGTTNEDKLIDIWNDDESGDVDSWRIEETVIND